MLRHREKTLDVVDLMWSANLKINEARKDIREIPFIFKEELFKMTNCTANPSCLPKPNYIFELKHNNEEKTKKFESLKADFNVQHAFHGSRFENFYSIFNIGLLSHMNKVSTFGEPTRVYNLLQR